MLLTGLIMFIRRDDQNDQMDLRACRFRESNRRAKTRSSLLDAAELNQQDDINVRAKRLL
jgi:hypothetical protein